MDRELQNKVLPVFHYSLMENGILFLGTSESVGDLAADFRNIDTRFKIYQKVGTISPATGTHRIHERLAIPQPAPLTAKTDTPVRTLGARVLAEQFSPPAVLVTERMEVRHFYGEVDRYLILASGEASLNVLQIARNGLRPRLAAALTQAIRDNIYISMENVRIRSGEEIVTIDLFVQPLIDPGRVQRFFLVIFRQNESRRKVASRTTKLSVPPAKSVSEIEALSQELKATKEYLQTTIEELQTSNEELRSTNEEFQSTNEELESSREELQSTNEELSTVNSELQEKVDELTQTSNDLNNLLSSTDIATIFLDTDLRIKRFTPTAVKVFRLQEGDIGRPIRDITSELVSINIYKAATEVLNTLVRKDMEVAAEGNRWFIVRILPYRTVDFIIEGVVLTFSEITDLKNALNEYESLESLAAGIVNSIRTPFVVLDTGLKVKVANGPFYELFRVRDVETIDKPIYELGSGQWDIDLLKRALGDIVEKSLPLINFEVEYDFPLIGHRKMILNGSRIEKSKYVYLSIENTAEQNT
jgi:two-component system CheB/CheR fusion protein